ncbi:hypothetical protein KFL_006170010 [Klebsormidium nitens]|uniref:Uncharacterized protein n=1 Tax=Klebsormidium nitens TaxID=105231 RepID=A0A1Y1IHQ5_KLENI|nr:hypothetical protein KFL_006170010 [Klebsormidium nitens]|eukprot:GAQ90233.1 hypothetical protein KFL_006170010 [Klebsormidium nitens]
MVEPGLAVVPAGEVGQGLPVGVAVEEEKRYPGDTLLLRLREKGLQHDVFQVAIPGAPPSEPLGPVGPAGGAQQQQGQATQQQPIRRVTIPDPPAVTPGAAVLNALTPGLMREADTTGSAARLERAFKEFVQKGSLISHMEAALRKIPRDSRAWYTKFEQLFEAFLLFSRPPLRLMQTELYNDIARATEQGFTAAEPAQTLPRGSEEKAEAVARRSGELPARNGAAPKGDNTTLPQSEQGGAKVGSPGKKPEGPPDAFERDQNVTQAETRAGCPKRRIAPRSWRVAGPTKSSRSCSQT